MLYCIYKDSLLFTHLFITVPLVQELATHFSQKHSVHHQMSFMWKMKSHSLQLWNCNCWIFQYLDFIYGGLTQWWHECFRLKHVVNFCVSDTAINCCLNDSLSVCSWYYSFLEIMSLVIYTAVTWTPVAVEWHELQLCFVHTTAACLLVLTEHLNNTGVC